MFNWRTVKIGFPNPEVPGVPSIVGSQYQQNSTNGLLQQLIELEQTRINLELEDQYYHNPNPRKVTFKYYSDTQTGITAGTTTPLKVIYPKDVQVMKRRGLVTHISIYSSGDTVGQTGTFSLYDNGSPLPSWQGIPVNTASSYAGEGNFKLPVPYELVVSHALQYQITNAAGNPTQNYYVVVFGYDDIGYFL